MKIAYIQNMRFPTEKAHGYQIMKTCEALSEQGAEIKLFVTDRKTPITEDPFKYYNIKKNIDIVPCPVFNLIPYFKSLIAPLGFMLERFTFLQSIKKQDLSWADIIYTRDPWLAPKLSQAFGKPVYLELHALPREQTIRNLKEIKGVLCLTKWMQVQIEEFLPGIKTEFLPDAVDLDIFDPKLSKSEARNALGLNVDEKIIMYGGRFSTMEQSKGLSLLDQAVSDAWQSNNNLKLYLIGGDNEDFKAYEGRNPSPTTTCIPAVSRNKLALYYRAADLLVLPFPANQHYSYEMSPLKLFEYMASGTPILSSDLPSIREILNEQSAYFYKTDNLSALTREISNIIQDQEQADKLAFKAKTIVNEFTWDNRAGKILNFIQNI